MIKTVIADTSVIVAILSEKDRWFEWALTQYGGLPHPFITCEPVITEACFLMRRSRKGEQNVLNWLADGILKIDFSIEKEIDPLLSLMKKYESVPMSLADACLVRMSEQAVDAGIFTLDSDFRIYRKNRNARIPLIIPDEL